MTKNKPTQNKEDSQKLVAKLKAEGYKVTYLCPIDIKEKIEKHNINYIQLPEINFGFSFLKPKGFLYHITHLKKQYNKGIKQEKNHCKIYFNAFVDHILFLIDFYLFVKCS